MDVKRKEMLRVILREILQQNLSQWKEGEGIDIMIDRIETRFFHLMALVEDQVI